MSDDLADYWRAHKEELRERRQKRRARGTVEIDQLGPAYRVERKSPYHFRINGLLDVWPTNRRFHCLRTQERGGYQSLDLLVRAHFG